MANESSSSSSRVPPPPSSSSSSSSSAVDSYIGSLISLTSKYEIRYEGVLYYLNPKDSTLGLKNVRSYGTEGRKKDGPQILPSDKVYEYILFRGSDIKDLQVKSSPPAQKDELMQNDPAIIQSRSSVGPSISSKPISVGGASSTQFTSYQEPPALVNTPYPVTLPLYQSGTSVGHGGSLQATQNANLASSAMPVSWPGYNGASSNFPYAPQLPNPLVSASFATSLPAMMQNHLQPSSTPASTAMGLTHSSVAVASVPSFTTSVHLNTTPTLTPDQHSTLSSMLSSSVKTSLPSHPALLTANRLTMTSFPSSCQNMNAIEIPTVAKASYDSQSLPCSASSITDSTLDPLLNAEPTLLTPDQLAQPRPPILSSTQNPYPDQKIMLAPNSASQILSSSISTPADQAPLLPLPLSAQQTQHSMPQFTEEFDFEAMNEKFKKDEVWGYLGASKGDETRGIKDNAVSQNLGQKGGYGLALKPDPKPAYNKDEFFDTISCNARGPRGGHNRFSERMKLDTETFGSFRQRPHLGYGGGRGGNYRGPCNWGRGYNYGGRGGGGSFHM